MDVIIAFFVGFLMGGGYLAITLKQIIEVEEDDK